jgi:hypothetical protein
MQASKGRRCQSDAQVKKKKKKLFANLCGCCLRNSSIKLSSLDDSVGCMSESVLRVCFSDLSGYVIDPGWVSIETPS